MRSLLLLAALVGCGGAQEAPERLGDEAWHRGDWAAAASHYARAGDSPQLLAKRGDAALAVGSLGEAATHFRRLGEADPERTGEAAAGLARVAAAAERGGDYTALAQSMVALQSISSGWPLGQLALRLPIDGPWDATMASTLPVMGLAAGGGDRWLLVLARGRQSAGRCDQAIAPLETLRRRDGGVLADTAGRLLASCELALGLEALAAGDETAADQWLQRAASGDLLGASTRRALVALGDRRLAQGDLAGALLYWQEVLTAPVPPDSITVMALERLRAPEPSVEPPDPSVVPGPP